MAAAGGTWVKGNFSMPQGRSRLSAAERKAYERTLAGFKRDAKLSTGQVRQGFLKSIKEMEIILGQRKG